MTEWTEGTVADDARLEIERNALRNLLTDVLARAEAAEAKVSAVLELCDSVPNTQTPLWPSQIRLAIEEAAQMGSFTDAADMTSSYDVGNDQQGETT